MQLNGSWWDKEEFEVGKYVFGFIDRTAQSGLNSARLANDIHHLRMYNSSPVGAMHYYTLDKKSSLLNRDRLVFNVIKSITDTLVNRIGTQKVRTYFLPSNADFGNHKLAKSLQKYADGLFNALNVHEVARDVLLDAAIYGTGFLRVRATQDKEIKIERVRQPDIIIDEVECVSEEPRQIHQRRFIHRDVLLALFPKKKAIILSAMESSAYAQSGYSNMIEVYESFHLRSGPEKEDGKYAVSIREGTLFVQDYDKDTMPFVKLKMGSKSIGWFGTGIPEQLRSLQREINQTLETIRICVKLSIPRVLVSHSAKVSESQIDDTIGAIIRHNPGQEPVFSNPSWVNADMIGHLEMLIRKAYQITGVPEYASFGTTPNARIDSASAIQTQTAATTERFGVLQKDFEDFFVKLSQKLLEFGKELYSDDVPDSVPGAKFIKTIPWDKVICGDNFSIQTFPTSLLPIEPAGKIDQIEKLAQLGIPQKEILQLLELPDVGSTIALNTADLEYIEDLIASWMDGGEYKSPEKYENLQLSLKRCLQVYLFYKNKNALMSSLPI
ncbi:MAG: hypothetical protein HC875_19125 [Anaerolineales bacterium]|nr:hypothetical protein [Anaerolineales bacterium]